MEGAEVVGGEGGEDFDGEGTLEGDEALVFEDTPFDGRGWGGVAEGSEVGGEVGEVFVAATGVGDDVECLGANAGDDGVVYNSTSFRVKEG